RKKNPIALEHNIEGEYNEDDDEEMEGTSEPSEANFKFTDFLKRFANQKILRACGIALKSFERNSVHTNYCILKLLHRIVWDLKMSSMAFQVSIFMTFQRIFSLKDLPQYKDLIKFATYVLRQFFKVAATNPKVFMEALFWKSSKDAYDIEEGYGSYQEKSKAETRFWSEAEENELTQLYNEHREKQIEEDVVDWIVDNLVDHTKTRRGVLKKLKELSLLTNYKKRGTIGSRSNVWTEEEEQKLRDLYDIYKNENNALELIADGLLTKRVKTKIVNKLLDMELIQNKNEIMKKRLRSNVSTNNGEGFHSSESEHSSSDGDDDSDNSSSSKIKPQPKQKTANRSNKKNSQAKTKQTQQIYVPKSDLIKILLKVSHMTDALDWLKESLSDIIEDRNESSDDAEDEIPLVAIMDYSVTAMENSDFQKLLKSFQIRPPADEQETYWRVPNYLTTARLEEYCQLLTDALENKLSNPDEVVASVMDENSNSTDEDVFDRVKRITQANNQETEPSTSSHNPENVQINHQSSITYDSDSDAGPSSANASNGRISLNEDPKTKPSKLGVFDSDDEEDKENKPEKVVSINRNFIESDSEEENGDSNSVEKDENKRERDISDTDSPLKKKKRSRLILSDDDSS
ncbi:hypothetical protein RN001_005104, partial [Aquatica leii]